MYFYDYSKLQQYIQTHRVDENHFQYESKTRSIEILKQVLSNDVLNNLNLSVRKTPAELLQQLMHDIRREFKNKQKENEFNYNLKWSPLISLYQQKMVDLANQYGFQAERYPDGDVKIKNTKYIRFSYHTPSYQRFNQNSKLHIIESSFLFERGDYDQYRIHGIQSINFQEFLFEKENWIRVLTESEAFFEEEMQKHGLVWGQLS